MTSDTVAKLTTACAPTWRFAFVVAKDARKVEEGGGSPTP